MCDVTWFWSIFFFLLGVFWQPFEQNDSSFLHFTRKFHNKSFLKAYGCMVWRFHTRSFTDKFRNIVQRMPEYRNSLEKFYVTLRIMEYSPTYRSVIVCACEQARTGHVGMLIAHVHTCMWVCRFLTRGPITGLMLWVRRVFVLCLSLLEGPGEDMLRGGEQTLKPRLELISLLELSSIWRWNRFL